MFTSTIKSQNSVANQLIAGWLAMLAVCIVFMPAAFAEKENIPSRDMYPEEWFKAPATASEMGIEKFEQAPWFEERVRSGDLPPVEERLPEDPIVVHPYDKPGEYGGVARGEKGMNGILNFTAAAEPPLRPGPLLSEITPNWAKGWEFAKDGKELFLYLREGVRWSDGHPLTAADFIFWFKHVYENPRLSPTGAETPWKSVKKLTAVDEFTLKYEFKKPRPLFINWLANQGGGRGGYLQPKHFLKQFHPAFTPEDELEKMVDELGLDNWMTLFNRAAQQQITKGIPQRPVLKPYMVTREGPQAQVLEANPYYPKVDPEGKQLPYIKKLVLQKIDNRELIAAKAATGQFTACANLNTADIPLFKKNEKKHNFHTLIWREGEASAVTILPNLAHPEPFLRKTFQDKRFRKALSLAINREEINELIYFGEGIVRQGTVIPSSQYFQQEIADKYTEHRPDKARQLLTEMGLKDHDGDGMRERPDGEPFRIILETAFAEKQKELSLIISYWREVGIPVHLRLISTVFSGWRVRANLQDVSHYHLDRASDILFPVEPMWWVPMLEGGHANHWHPWSAWYLSEGEKGEQPPPEYMQLIDWWEKMRVTTDKERRIKYGRKILRANIENLYSIGVIGLAPKPMLISNRLRNVPPTGYYVWDGRYTYPYRFETWYLEQDN